LGDTILGLAPADWRALWLSVRISAAAIAISLPAGVALGWILARKTFPGKAAVETIVALPLVLPPVVTGLLLLYALGPRSAVGGWLWNTFGLQLAFTWRAAVIAVAIVGFPLLVRSVRVAFEGVDPRLYQAARSLGAGPLDAFRTVSLPLARHGVIAGLVLAFARGLGEFGATMMFASIRPETTTLAIQIYVLHNQPGDLSEGRMWSVVVASVLLAFLSLVVSEYFVRRGRQHELA
jgi:molybdate transport system permease protein